MSAGVAMSSIGRMSTNSSGVLLLLFLFLSVVAPRCATDSSVQGLEVADAPSFHRGVPGGVFGATQGRRPPCANNAGVERDQIDCLEHDAKEVVAVHGLPPHSRRAVDDVPTEKDPHQLHARLPPNLKLNMERGASASSDASTSVSSPSFASSNSKLDSTPGTTQRPSSAVVQLHDVPGAAGRRADAKAASNMALPYHAPKIDFDGRSMLVMLQTMQRVEGMAEVRASQYFELIEDPLLNILVPILIDIVVSMSKQGFIDALCKMLVPFIADLLAIPLGLSLWPGINPGNFPGAAGLEGFDMSEYNSFKSSSSSSSTTTTVVEEVVEEFVDISSGSVPSHLSGDQHATNYHISHLDSVAASPLLEVHGCEGITSPEACESHTSGRCVWCKEVSGYLGHVATCRSCDGLSGKVSSVECPRASQRCSSSHFRFRSALGNNGKPPPISNEMADKIVLQVVDAAITHLMHSLRLPVVNILRVRIKNAVTRGVTRSLTRALTKALTERLDRNLFPNLVESLSVVNAKRLTAGLTASLTQTIAPAIVLSLVRDPKADYACAYCNKYGKYCALCRSGTSQDQWLTAQAWHNAQHTAQYYGWYYGGHIM